MKKLNQNQISTVCDRLAENIPSLLEYFEIEGIEYPNRYSFPCPIHGGDSQRVAVCLRMAIQLRETGDVGQINANKITKAIYLGLLEVYCLTKRVEICR